MALYCNYWYNFRKPYGTGTDSWEKAAQGDLHRARADGCQRAAALFYLTLFLWSFTKVLIKFPIVFHKNFPIKTSHPGFSMWNVRYCGGNNADVQQDPFGMEAYRLKSLETHPLFWDGNKGVCIFEKDKVILKANSPPPTGTNSLGLFSRNSVNTQLCWRINGFHRQSPQIFSSMSVTFPKSHSGIRKSGDQWCQDFTNSLHLFQPKF